MNTLPCGCLPNSAGVHRAACPGIPGMTESQKILATMLETRMFPFFKAIIALIETLPEEALTDEVMARIEDIHKLSEAEQIVMRQK